MLGGPLDILELGPNQDKGKACRRKGDVEQGPDVGHADPAQLRHQQRRDHGACNAQQPCRCRLAQHHPPGPVLIEQAVAADGRAAVASAAVAYPINAHGQHAVDPVWRQGIHKVGGHQHTDAKEVDLFGPNSVNQYPGKGPQQAGDDHADAGNQAKLCLGGAQCDDVDGQQYA